MRRLELNELSILEQALGVSPETVIALHHLKRGLADGYISGDTAFPRGVVVQLHERSAEPFAFGDDAAAIWAILQVIPDWVAVNVDQRVARDLRPIMKWYFPVVRPLENVYYMLRGALKAPPIPDIEARLLIPADIGLLEAADAPLQGGGFGSGVALLRDGVAAGALYQPPNERRPHLVALAHTGAYAGRYADVAAFTEPDYRNRGLSTYAAYLVMRELLSRGLSPIWSSGEDNRASRRVADKLGMGEISRRVYLIPSR
jgi:hypothetical protein